MPLHPPSLVAGMNTLVICADGGAALARRWGITPEIIVGDEDSLDAVTKEYWQRQKVPFLKVSSVKDETDMDLAVEYALAQGAMHITLVGGWGSRIDHSLGNIELLYRLALKGIENALLTKEHRLHAFSREFKAKVDLGHYVSLVPLTPQVTGVATTGLLYALEGGTLEKGSTFTISNETVATDIIVRTESGVLLVIM